MFSCGWSACFAAFCCPQDGCRCVFDGFDGDCYTRINMDRTDKRFCRKTVVGLATAGICLVLCGMAGRTPDVEANLLENGGFERGTNETPLAWAASVESADGAFSLWDSDVSHGGLRSVRLSTKVPYTGEPFNNWYQNIETPLGGRKLTLRGYIKGHDVQDAAVWLQCFQRGSPVPVAVATSNTNSSPTGDFGWTEQRVDIDVPQGTTLVVTRLVMVGTGTVWFDDISLAVSEPTPDVGATEPEVPADLNEKLEAIAEENKSLRQSYEKLSETIERLVARVQSLQDSIEVNRTQSGSNEPAVGLPFIIPDRNIVGPPPSVNRPAP